MADELIALFTTLVTDDHDDLIAQFSNIMKTDQEVARFFLEASSWNVEKAVHNFLASYGNMQADQLHTTRSAPEVKLLSDLSEVQSVSFGPRSFIPMSWRFMNAGQEAWPADTRLVFVDGERMSGPTETPLQGVNPGEETYVNCRLRAPSGAGTYAGTWRMVCNAGYFGDPLWIIITVGNPAEGDDGGANGLVYFDKDGQKVSEQEFKQQQQRQQQQQQQLLQSQRNRTRPQYTQFAQFHPSQFSGHQFTGDHISEPQEAMFDVDDADDADDDDADVDADADVDVDDVGGGGGGVSASVRNGIGNGHVPQPLFNNTSDNNGEIHQQGSIGMGMAPQANRFPPLQQQPQQQQQHQQPQPQQQQAQHVHDQFALPSSALFSQSQAPPHTHTQPQPQPSTMQGFGNTGGVSAGAPPTSSGGIQLSQPSFQVNSGLSSMFSLQQNPQYPNQQQQQQQQQQGQQPHQHQLHQQQPQQQGGANVNHEMDL